jgi:hypothetical protein
MGGLSNAHASMDLRRVLEAAGDSGRAPLHRRAAYELKGATAPRAGTRFTKSTTERNMASINAPRRRLRRRVAIIVIAGIAGIGGVTAAAYFLTRGTATTTGNAVIGGTPAPIAFELLLSAPTGPALTPGGSAQTLNVFAQNTSSTPLATSITPSLRSDGTGIFDTTSGQFVDACKAVWFSLSTVNPPGTQYSLPANMTSVSNIDGVLLKLNDSGTDQSACESLTPEVDVSAS